MGNTKIIDGNDPGIVVSETQVTISDEKLIGLLYRTYEVALCDARKFRIHDLWGVCWSIVGTLILALFTSDFKSLGTIDSSIVTNIAIIGTVLIGIAAIILTIWRVREKITLDLSDRDNAVDKIMNDYNLKRHES